MMPSVTPAETISAQALGGTGGRFGLPVNTLDAAGRPKQVQLSPQGYGKRKGQGPYSWYKNEHTQGNLMFDNQKGQTCPPPQKPN